MTAVKSYVSNVVEGMQWTGENIEDIEKFVGVGSDGDPNFETDADGENLQVYSDSEDSWVGCDVEDFIVKYDGDLLVFKKAVFESLFNEWMPVPDNDEEI